ncbi:uncharacterized protein [Oscarella lobularis]|uniref:uncharacterized protein n=1 Tax=Oscarella lobularis TaxID=121494 RepID=UPI0033143BEA
MWRTLLFVASTIGAAVNANCPDYVFIPPSRYNTDPPSLNDPSSNPYGYYQATIPSVERPDQPRECVTIKAGAGEYMIEIKLESVQSGGRVCAEDPQGKEYCGTGTATGCYVVPVNNPTYKFVCDTSCTSADTPLWYRFVLQNITSYAGSDPNDWCNDRNTDEFPSNLNLIPTTFVQPNKPTNSLGGGSAPLVFSFFTLFTSFAVAFGLF